MMYIFAHKVLLLLLPGRHRLRLSASQLLHVPAYRLRLTTVGRRSFPVAASVIWNLLHPDVQSSATFSVSSANV